MIQRVQSLYLGIAIICLLFITFGANLFNFQVEKTQAIDLTMRVNVFGSQADAEVHEAISATDYEEVNAVLKLKDRTRKVDNKPLVSMPFYMISIFLTLLCGATLIAYKKLPTQQKLARLNFVLHLVAFVFLLIVYYLVKNQVGGLLSDAESKAQLGIGFYLLVVAVACTFLAGVGIKKDLNLIKSIDRIR